MRMKEKKSFHRMNKRREFNILTYHYLDASGVIKAAEVMIFQSRTGICRDLSLHKIRSDHSGHGEGGGSMFSPEDRM